MIKNSKSYCTTYSARGYMKTLVGLLFVAACDSNCHPDQQHVMNCIAACSASGVSAITYTRCICKGSIHSVDAGAP